MSGTGGGYAINRYFSKIRAIGGVVQMDYEKIENELLSRIDSKDIIGQEKVKRYMNLLMIFYELDNDIEERGAMVVTENGAQSFVKANPAISEKNKINSSLIALNKDLGLNEPIKKDTDSYSSSDLI